MPFVPMNFQRDPDRRARLLDGDGFPIYEFRWFQAGSRTGLWIGTEKEIGRVMSGVLWNPDDDPITWRVVEVTRSAGFGFKAGRPINEETWPTLIKAKSAAERYMTSLLVVEALNRTEP